MGLNLNKRNYNMKSFLYALLRLLNDITAIFTGRVGKRIINKGIGRTAGRLYRK